MKIAVLSDTHGWLDDRLLAHLHQADEIWHAGDVGSIEVIGALRQLPGKLRVVQGNIDGRPVRLTAPEYLSFTAAGMKVLLTHIAGNPPTYNRAVRQLINELKPGMLVCGHSHILKVMPDKANNLLYVNPGACGNHGFHKIRTFIKLTIANGRPANMQVVELGKRGRIAMRK